MVGAQASVTSALCLYVDSGRAISTPKSSDARHGCAISLKDSVRIIALPDNTATAFAQRSAARASQPFQLREHAQCRGDRFQTGGFCYVCVCKRLTSKSSQLKTFYEKHLNLHSIELS